MEEILIKAKELGDLLAESTALNRYKKAEKILENDEKGMSLLEDLRLLKIELVRAAREDRNEEDISELKEMLLSKQEEIYSYPVTREYIDSKKEFDDLMKNVNDIISFSITGEECFGSKCSSCGGGCSSCR